MSKLHSKEQAVIDAAANLLENQEGLDFQFPDKLRTCIEEYDLSDQEYHDILDRLDHYGLLKVRQGSGRLVPVGLTAYGFDIWAQESIENYRDKVCDILISINKNDGIDKNVYSFLESATGLSINFISKALEVLKEKDGYIKMHGVGVHFAIQMTPKGRQSLEP